MTRPEDQDPQDQDLADGPQQGAGATDVGGAEPDSDEDTVLRDDRIRVGGTGAGHPGAPDGPRRHVARSSRTNWDDQEEGTFGGDGAAGGPAAAGAAGLFPPPGRPGPGTPGPPAPPKGPPPGAPTPKSERARHRRNRALISLALVLLAMFFAFWFAYSYFKGDAASDPNLSTAPTCQPADPNAVVPSKVKVNVYNSTTRAGLAKATSEQVANLGFVVGKVANDPLKRKIAGPAEVRFGPNGKAGADLIVAAIGKGATTKQDQRKDATVDLVLGDAFTKLGPLPSPSGLPVCPAPAPSTSPVTGSTPKTT